MALAGALDHFGRKVHADAVCRPKRCKQITCSTADLQHTPAWADQETIYLLNATMIGFSPTAPRIASASHFIPMGNTIFLISALGVISNIVLQRMIHVRFLQL